MWSSVHPGLRDQPESRTWHVVIRPLRVTGPTRVTDLACGHPSIQDYGTNPSHGPGMWSSVHPGLPDQPESRTWHVVIRTNPSHGPGMWSSVHSGLPDQPESRTWHVVICPSRTTGPTRVTDLACGHLSIQDYRTNPSHGPGMWSSVHPGLPDQPESRSWHVVICPSRTTGPTRVTDLACGHLSTQDYRTNPKTWLNIDTPVMTSKPVQFRAVGLR